MKLSHRVDGLARLTSMLREKPAQTVKRLAANMYREANRIMTESKRIVPVDTGALMSTGYVTTPEISAGGVKVELGYGGPAAPYAIHVHENLDPRIQWQRPGSGPKYLERPWKAALPGLAERLTANTLGEKTR